MYKTCFLNAEKIIIFDMQLFQIDRGLLDGVCADEVVLDLLPPGYGYKVVTFEINDNQCDNNSKFILEVRVSTKDFG